MWLSVASAARGPCRRSLRLLSAAISRPVSGLPPRRPMAGAARSVSAPPEPPAAAHLHRALALHERCYTLHRGEVLGQQIGAVDGDAVAGFAERDDLLHAQ